MYDIKRSGFAMIMAIFVVVLIALGGTLILRNSATSSQSVNDNYIRIQAELLANSGIEFAAMQMQGIDTNETGNPCLNSLNITVEDQSGTDMYDINITLKYAFVNPIGSTVGCTKLMSDRVGSGTSMVLIDAVVTDHNLSTESIRIHKRSWQKL